MTRVGYCIHDHILALVSLTVPQIYYSFSFPISLLPEPTKWITPNVVLSAIDLSSPTLCCPCPLPHISILLLAAAASGLARRHPFSSLGFICFSCLSPEHPFWVDHPVTRMKFQPNLVAQVSEQIRMRRNSLCFSDLGTHLIFLIRETTENVTWLFWLLRCKKLRFAVKTNNFPVL